MTEKESKERIAEQEARAETFQRLHAEGVIEHELRKAAEEVGAFNADQIVTLLKGSSRLVEVNGKHVARVVAVGGDGQEIHHTVPEAIGHMKQNLVRYQGLPVTRRGRLLLFRKTAVDSWLDVPTRAKYARRSLGRGAPAKPNGKEVA